MNDAAVEELARRAGIAVDWRDYANKQHRASAESLRLILAALGLPCDTAADLAESRRQLEAPRPQPLITATIGQPSDVAVAARKIADRVRLTYEDGTIAELPVRGAARGVRLPGIETPGYHVIEFGTERITIAIAPRRCCTIADIAPEGRLWGLAAQIYGLRSAGDCGIGDTAGVIALARKAAALRADAIALSPVHALFAADCGHFSPYSPSSRLFYNPLQADARVLFKEARVAKAADEAGVAAAAGELEQQRLIDWRQSARAKMALFRRLFEDFSSTDLAAKAATPQATDFAQFRAAGGALLAAHALFEALHAAKSSADASAWNWRGWGEPWRNPASEEVRSFAETNADEVAFHCFLQWIADRSLAAAQRATKEAGMCIGLVSDLAVGISGAGSEAWGRPNDLLMDLQIGAPPDAFNAKGQNWGLTTFSPRGLAAGGFAAFIDTLRACLRHCGGLRIDHAMGLQRLWVVPRGAEPIEGAYLTYPADDLLRLTALESHRRRAIIIGEDLGTVPAGFRERIGRAGICGMRVLWFERERNRFVPPQAWSAMAAAMTSTHDLPTVAGWWRGTDIDVRAQCGLIEDADKERAARTTDREMLWRAFRRAKAAEGDSPAPTDTSRVADAAVKFIAQTPSELALLPLEDALAVEDQPNLPG
ncbi:MAG: 4-alpha-glucanotransferase, partial [Proteobacteria bacterium]